jgi:hypothetical protein
MLQYRWFVTLSSTCACCRHGQRLWCCPRPCVAPQKGRSDAIATFEPSRANELASDETESRRIECRHTVALGDGFRLTFRYHRELAGRPSLEQMRRYHASQDQIVCARLPAWQLAACLLSQSRSLATASFACWTRKD